MNESSIRFENAFKTLLINNTAYKFKYAASYFSYTLTNWTNVYAVLISDQSSVAKATARGVPPVASRAKKVPRSMLSGFIAKMAIITPKLLVLIKEFFVCCFIRILYIRYAVKPLVG